MSEIFLNIVNMSLAASWLIAVIIVLRLVLKKAPKWLMPVLWGVAGLRLMIPFSLESDLSLIPSAKPLPEEMLHENSFHVYSGVSVIDEPVNRFLVSREVGAASEKVTGQDHLMAILGIIWVIGVCVMLLYALFSYIRLKSQVRASIRYEGNVWLSDQISSPFILGVIRPGIFLPIGLDPENVRYVLEHERAHLKRWDHIIKPIGFVVLSVYWFNPLVWAAYILLCQDIELACDEKAIAGYGFGEKKAYAAALLDCSMHRRMVMACPLAFGEAGVKERVKSVLNYKNPALGIVIIALIACVVTGVCFLTNPPQRSFEARIVIPAGSEYGCYTSDEEVRAAFGGITLLGLRDEPTYLLAKGNKTEVVLVPAESYGTDDDSDIMTYTTTKFPSTFDAPRKNWYRVGINTDNPTDEDFVLYVRVQNVNARIETESSDQAAVEITRPSVDLSASLGADPPELLYADEDRIIFSGYFGLFVYSKKDRNIASAVDLAAIDCDQAQGEDACEKFVGRDGNTVYLHPMSRADMFVYDIQTDTMTEEPFNLDHIDLHALPDDDTDRQNPYDIWSDGKKTMETQLIFDHQSGMIGDLGFIDSDEANGRYVSQFYPLFSPDGFTGAVDLSPDEISGIKSAQIWIHGAMLHTEDEDLLAQLEALLSNATMIKGKTACPFNNALYITRSDGTVGWVFPATDSCAMYMSGNGCYKFTDGDNDELWNLIDRFGSTNTRKADNPIGVILKVVDVNPTGCMMFFVQNSGIITGQLETGQPLLLQKQDKDGSWSDLPMLENAGWEDVAYDLKTDSATELYINWENIYGVLEPGHYKIIKSVMDYRAPGDYDKYDVSEEFDIRDDTGESVTDWLSIELPYGYGISHFYDNIGYMGGSLILPRSYNAEVSEYGPVEWQYSGLISRLPVESGMATVTFDNGIPNPACMPHDNHTDSEYVKTIGLEQSNTQWTAVMLKENHDLYTASQVGEMESEGVDLTGKDLTSDYWTFWFVKEGEQTYYVVTLSAKEFSQKEAEKIAESVTIK